MATYPPVVVRKHGPRARVSRRSCPGTVHQIQQLYIKYSKCYLELALTLVAISLTVSMARRRFLASSLTVRFMGKSR